MSIIRCLDKVYIKKGSEVINSIKLLAYYN